MPKIFFKRKPFSVLGRILASVRTVSFLITQYAHPVKRGILFHTSTIIVCTFIPWYKNKVF